MRSKSRLQDGTKSHSPRLLVNTQATPSNTRRPMSRLFDFSSKLDRSLACPCYKFLYKGSKSQNLVFTELPGRVVYCGTRTQPLLTTGENISTLRPALTSPQTRKITSRIRYEPPPNSGGTSPKRSGTKRWWLPSTSL